MNRPRRLRSSLSLLALLSTSGLLMAAACDDEDDPTAGPAGFGSASVFLTDAPSDDFDHILVTIEGLELIGDGPHVELFSGSETVDLKQLEHFSDLFVHADDVPAGHYTKIRMAVTEIQLVRDDPNGEVIDVKPPANGKIDMLARGGFYVRDGVNLTIEIDIDAEKSIHLVERGNGEYGFRPVVFVTIEEGEPPQKLSRVHGIVEEFLDATTLELCSTMFVASRDFGHSSSVPDGGIGERMNCITVLTDSATGVFDENGDPTPLSSVAPRDEITVVGRFQRMDYGDGPSIDPVALSAPTHSRNTNGNGHGGNNNGNNNGDSDSDSDSYSDSDSDSDSDGSQGRLTLLAFVIEQGPSGTFEELRGVILSALDPMDLFDFRIASGQGSTTPTVVQALLQMGTRIFDTDGVELDDSAIRALAEATIDGVFADASTSTGVLKTALIVIDVDPTPADMLSGDIESIDDALRQLTLRTDAGGGTAEECVDVPDEADVFLIGEDDIGATSERGSFEDLVTGQRIDVFGMFPYGATCFEAETIIAFDEAIECASAADCEVDQFCSQSACGAIGVCEQVPEVCSFELAPVCGCDIITYGNECLANAAGISVESAGACGGVPQTCSPSDSLSCASGELCLVESGMCDPQAMGVCVKAPAECPDVDKPVCGCDAKAFRNACEAATNGVVVASEGACSDPVVCGGTSGAKCGTDEVCRIGVGMCSLDATGVCVPAPMDCPQVIDPVCGCDGNTYDNACLALVKQVPVDFPGACTPQPQPCDATLACAPDQVCMVEEGMCDPAASGLCVDRPDACGGVFDPVCGCDATTYVNACAALAAGATVESQGSCEPPVVECGGPSGATCAAGEFCRTEEGMCSSDAIGTCVKLPAECTDDVKPVCGCDLESHLNECAAAQAGVGVFAPGVCSNVGLCGGPTDLTCAVGALCLIESLVCDPDALGACIKAPPECPTSIKPVCGCDGNTYDNACTAAVKGAPIAHDGACLDFASGSVSAG